jgi:hypothetical protein
MHMQADNRFSLGSIHQGSILIQVDSRHTFRDKRRIHPSLIRMQCPAQVLLLPLLDRFAPYCSRLLHADHTDRLILQEPSKEVKLKKFQEAKAEAEAKIAKLKAEHQMQIHAQQAKHIEQASTIQKENQAEFLKLKYQHDVEMLPLLQKDSELDQLIKLKSASS